MNLPCNIRSPKQLSKSFWCGMLAKTSSEQCSICDDNEM